jgi:methionine-rich copper-binding protein CopC
MLVLTATAAASAGTWHNRLVKAEPGIDSTVHRSPNRVELWFAERPDLGLTTIRLRLSEDSTKLFKLGEVKAGADPHAAAATVPSPLPPGSYTVVYRTAGVDGHVVRGSYRFTLAK